MTSTMVPGAGPTYAVVALDDTTARLPAVDQGATLCRALVGGVTTVVVDVSGLSQLSSETVTALLQLRRQASTLGGRVVLQAAAGRRAAMLTRSPLAGLFEVTTTAAPRAPWRHP